MADKAGANGKERGGARERTWSTGRLEEAAKRKREEGEEGSRKMMEGIFQRSKKTQRSPRKEERMEGGEHGEVSGRWKEEIGEILEEMRGMRGWREEFRKMRKELREGLREQGEWIREEMEEMRKEMKQREVKWEEEKEEMRRRIGELEKRMKGVGGEGVRGEEGSDNIGNRLRTLERKWEAKEREERRRNIIIKGAEVKEGKRREAAEEVIEAMGVKAEIEGVWKLGKGEREGREMILVKLKEESQRKEILEKKRNLRGRKERVVEDWTWEERRTRWKLEEIARKEEGRGKQVWVGYGKIRIGGQWWRWESGSF